LATYIDLPGKCKINTKEFLSIELSQIHMRSVDRNKAVLNQALTPETIQINSNVVCLPWSYIGVIFSGRGSIKMLPWTLVSVRNGRLWNVTRNF